MALQPIVSPQKISQVTDSLTKNTVFSPAFMNQPHQEWLSQSQQPAVRSSSNITPHNSEAPPSSQPNSLRYVLVNGSPQKNQILVREMLTKKSMKVLVTLKKNAYKTQYGKLLRAKKEEEGKKSTFIN